MSSGYIPAKDEPWPDEILGALHKAVADNPKLEEMPAVEVARQLVLEGRLQGEPSPALVAGCWTPLKPRRAPSRPRSRPRRATPRECETNQSLEKGVPSRGVSRETSSWLFTTPKDQRRYRRGVVTAYIQNVRRTA